jgi:hypothetical protein
MNVIQNFRGKNRFFPYLKKKTTFFFIIVNFSHYSFNFLNNKFKIKINTLNYENKKKVKINTSIIKYSITHKIC